MDQPQRASNQKDQCTEQGHHNARIAMVAGDAGDDGKAQAASDKRGGKKRHQGKAGNTGTDGDNLVRARGEGTDKDKDNAKGDKSVLNGGEFLWRGDDMWQHGHDLFDSDTKTPPKRPAHPI
mgnify:CR=1 FL=1